MGTINGNLGPNVQVQFVIHLDLYVQVQAKGTCYLCLCGFNPVLLSSPCRRLCRTFSLISCSLDNLIGDTKNGLRISHHQSFQKGVPFLYLSPRLNLYTAWLYFAFLAFRRDCRCVWFSFCFVFPSFDSFHLSSPVELLNQFHYFHNFMTVVSLVI